MAANITNREATRLMEEHSRSGLTKQSNLNLIQSLDPTANYRKYRGQRNRLIPQGRNQQSADYGKFYRISDPVSSTKK